MDKFFTLFWNIFFPKQCILCHKERPDLCTRCLPKLSTLVRPLPEATWALYDFRDRDVRKIIWQLKYHNRFGIAQTLGLPLYERLLDEYTERNTFTHLGKPIIIPIPLSRTRLRERGYNQATRLAEAMLTHDVGKTFYLDTTILKRKNQEVHQARTANKQARMKNARHTFTIHNTEQIRGKTIILIDDVLTTGATCAEATRVLKHAGAKRVFILTIAH